MSQPLSGIPDPGTPRPFKRSIQPGVVQSAMQTALRRVGPYSRELMRKGKRSGDDAWRRARRGGQDLWLRGKRNPRAVALGSAALAVTLVGAIALSATGRSMCPPSNGGKTPPFLLLMDPVPPTAAGGEIDIRYDVCGLRSGAPYSARLQLTRVKPAGKKLPKVKPIVENFQSKVDGLASRREHELQLGSLKPGAYSLELLVMDKQGRERKKVQKVQVISK
jgi:hypothetical protein